MRHRKTLLALWVVVSAVLVAAGAWVRFDGPRASADPLLQGILFFFASLMTTVALVCSLALLRHLPAEADAERIVGAALIAPASAMGALVLLGTESDAAAEARHRAHLAELGRVVAEDYRRNGRMPRLIETAADRAGVAHSQIADADGGPVLYRRLGDRTALLCAPEQRRHVVVREDRVIDHPWPVGGSDPCRAISRPPPA